MEAPTKLAVVQTVVRPNHRQEDEEEQEPTDRLAKQAQGSPENESETASASANSSSSSAALRDDKDNQCGNASEDDDRRDDFSPEEEENPSMLSCDTHCNDLSALHEKNLKDKTFCLLGEVVAGYDLKRDFDSKPGLRNHDNSNHNTEEMLPYCILRYGNKVIHKTKKGAGKNPIWSISTNSLFLLHTTPRELAHDDLQISVWFKRKDALNLTVIETGFLGKAILNGKNILSHCDEECFTVDLHDDRRGSLPEEESCGRGSLTVRFRLATPADEAFVNWTNQIQDPAIFQLQSSSARKEVFKLLHSPPRLASPSSSRNDDTSPDNRPIVKFVTEKDETKVAGASFVQAISDAFSHKTLFDQSTGAPKYRVKPHPDPSRVEDTTYMTAGELNDEYVKPSREWIEAGSGTLGKIFVEVLRCDDLPNVDVGEAVGNLTDAFVCAVFEDAMVQTPVIDDELSPMWMPWTQRAFAFGMMHPSSVLYLGVFDYDIGPQDHEAIGRVAVNISNLQRNTDYTLQYNLYKSSNMTKRSPSGKITIRLRIEYNDEKEALLKAMELRRPKFHVNCLREKSLSVVRYTCFGECGDAEDQTFDLAVTRSYVNEIFEYKSVLSYCINDSLKSLIFWDGQVDILGMYLPIHSLVFFFTGVLLVEKPYMLPSFVLLAMAWIMLASLTVRRQHPSPWGRVPSFRQYIDILRTGKSKRSVRGIHVNEGATEAQKYEREWTERLEKDLKLAERKAALAQEVDDLGDENIHTKIGGGLPLDLVARLTRYQGKLARICRFFRFIKIIVSWEESILSFWLTACFLVAGLVSLVLPWAFILRWVGRIVVWGLLGPHMKIVGIFLRGKYSQDDDKVLQRMIESFQEKSRSARLRHQEAVKLKDLKELSFGNFSTLIPAFNLSRHYDRPLPESSATLHRPSLDDEIKFAKYHVPGQQCFGGIIPRPHDVARQFEVELPKLAKLVERIEGCVDEIQEAENIKMLKRLKNLGSHDEDIPDSVGYELLSINEEEDENALLDTKDPNKKETHLRLGDTSSLLVNNESRIAVLSERRKSRRESAATRSSARWGYEVISFADDGEEQDLRDRVVRLASSSALIMSKDSHLSIMETSEKNRANHTQLLEAIPSQTHLDASSKMQHRTDSTDEEEEEAGVEVTLEELLSSTAFAISAKQVNDAAIKAATSATSADRVIYDHSQSTEEESEESDGDSVNETTSVDSDEQAESSRDNNVQYAHSKVNTLDSGRQNDGE